MRRDPATYIPYISPARVIARDIRNTERYEALQREGICSDSKGLRTFKELEQARLLKHMVVPASELAARKQAEIDRANAFTRAAADQEFYAVTTEPSVSPRDPTPIGVRVGIVTREPYEEQP